MKKLLLASAVSAAFAAPGVAFAQAKPPAAPTLDKVLEASGISVSGYIDAGYTHSDKNQGSFTTKVFDIENNSFALRQFGLTVAKQPKEGFGGLVNLTVGKDAQLIHSFPEAAPGSTFDVTQGYLQYATGSLTVIAGKFTTLHGTEVIASSGNTNISRSILFGSVPFTHTGVRGTYAVTDTISLIAGVNNGWDQLTDSTRTKTLELGATLNPIKPLTIAVSGYSGKETVPQSTPGATEGSRTSLNAVVSYAIIDPLSVGLELLSVQQDNAPVSGGGTGKAKFTGEALYVTYMPMPKLRAVLRAENFDDKDGFRYGTADRKYKELTLTAAYLASDSFEARAELRRDSADKEAFFKYGSTTADSKSMMSVALQALYKF
ncbi:MAG TPA: outer membrane beta-barrel protein [Burkholderiales bacterium]|jgi:hypothetical protein